MRTIHLVIDPKQFQRFTRVRSRVEIKDEILDSKEVRAFKKKVAVALADALKRAFSGEILPGMTGRVDSDRLRVALGQPKISRNAVVIPIADRYGSMTSLRAIENGQEQLDLKPFLLNSPSAKQGLSGRYVIVPLGHDLPSGGTRAQKINARLDEYEAASNQKPIRGRGTGRVYANPTTGAPHKAPMAARMQVKGVLGLTFRTVSTNSDPDSWIVPARKSNPVREAAVAEALRQVTP